MKSKQRLLFYFVAVIVTVLTAASAMLSEVTPGFGDGECTRRLVRIQRSDALLDAEFASFSSEDFASFFISLSLPRGIMQSINRPGRRALFETAIDADCAPLAFAALRGRRFARPRQIYAGAFGGCLHLVVEGRPISFTTSHEPTPAMCAHD